MASLKNEISYQAPKIKVDKVIKNNFYRNFLKIISMWISFTFILES